MVLNFKAEEPGKFVSPQEEIDFLRERLARREYGVLGDSESGSKDIQKEVIKEYASKPAVDVLHPEKILPENEVDRIVLDLKPEKHDSQMEELLGLLIEKGARNALSVVEKMDNPHISDDFHRILVQYVKTAGNVPELEKEKQVWKSVHMRLYEILLPEASGEKQTKNFKEIVTIMEQFYAGMLSISDGRDNFPGKNYFTLEIALSNWSSDIVFYASVPEDRGELLEKQLLGLYPNARIKEVKDDYNIFNEKGASVGAYGSFTKSQVFPIKTYAEFDHDPLLVVLNVFSKLKKEGEGAAIQFSISPVGDYFLKKYGGVLDELKRGIPVKEATDVSSTMGHEVGKFAKELLMGVPKPRKVDGKDVLDDEAIKHVSEKIGSTIVNTNIRVIASAETTARAEEILSELQSAFNQFTDTKGNGIEFKTLKRRELLKLFREFSYRLFSQERPLPLNLKELTTMFHFPEEISSAPQLKQARSATAPAPLDAPTEGMLLGVNRHRGEEKKIFIADEDRMRHFYVIGQTGTGKTVILKNMIIQDIKAGHGVCMIDPHGTDIEDILGNIPPEREKDVVYFDPAYTERVMGLNMLEYDLAKPEQKTFVVNELISIFNKLFDMKVAGGPAFEQYFRNSALLVMEHPESGNTLLEIVRVLADKSFRDMKLSYCKNPVVIQFWANAIKTSGEQSLANFVPYISSKFDPFLSNDIMRPVIAQEKSSFNFRQIMDEKKILLVNLSKGRLGDLNAHLIGLILVGKILIAALSRVDNIGKKPEDFYLYVDEFQNVTTDSISTILSEARKYRLSLNVAHQFIGQLEDKIKNAVFGNVGSMAVFRVGSEDAEFLEKQLAPVFSSRDIMNQDNYNAYMKMLMNGQPARAFNIATFAPEKGDSVAAERIKQASYQKFGTPRVEVEEHIAQKYRQTGI
jgi:hypothetical protein